jgi:hypothetical protein
MTLLALILAAGCAAQTAPTLEQAQPAARFVVQKARALDQDYGPAIAGDLPNFHEVELGFYRLAQPTRAGLRTLKRDYRLNTILTLRLAVDGDERDEAGRLRIEVRHVSMLGVLAPRFKEVDAALAILKDQALRPIAVHCQHGRDRTGTVVAAYRVVVMGKDPREAADEAKTIGCCPPTWRTPLQKYLEAYKRHAAGDKSAVEPEED